MSPRSEEFFLTARERLEAAAREMKAGDGSAAISLAYYAMLFAIRAALSEEDLYARTHKGLWGLFHETFVTTGRFSSDLHKAGAATQELREKVDYDAEHPDAEKAGEVVATAKRFVDAVTEMLDD